MVDLTEMSRVIFERWLREGKFQSIEEYELNKRVTQEIDLYIILIDNLSQNNFYINYNNYGIRLILSTTTIW